MSPPSLRNYPLKYQYQLYQLAHRKGYTYKRKSSRKENTRNYTYDNTPCPRIYPPPFIERTVTVIFYISKSVEETHELIIDNDTEDYEIYNSPQPSHLVGDTEPDGITSHKRKIYKFNYRHGKRGCKLNCVSKE